LGLVVKLSEVRRLALSLPETNETGHHGIPSFRVANKIFATVPDDKHVNVMVGPDETAMAVGASAEACEELWWGRKQAGVRVTLAAADIDLVTVLLREAWLRKAPPRLTKLVGSSDPRA
jgi:hypothetical protein